MKSFFPILGLRATACVVAAFLSLSLAGQARAQKGTLPSPAAKAQAGTIPNDSAEAGWLRQAYGLLYGTLQQQAALFAYVDTFRVLAVLCAVCVPIVLLFKRVKRHKGPVGPH